MPGLRSQLLAALDFAQAQLRRLIREHPGLFPVYTQQGRWKHDCPTPSAAEGLLPGMMWLLAGCEQADDPEFWREQAATCWKRVATILDAPASREFGLSFYHAIRPSLETDAHFQSAAVRAAQLLALRFRPAGQYLRSTHGDDSLLIDSMPEIPLLLFGARHIAREDFSPEGLNPHEIHRRAMQHGLTVIRTLCRADGSAAHEGLFNADTGEFLRQSTRRGFRGDSTLARAVADSMLGFTSCFALARDRRFLKMAEIHAEFWLTSTPATGIPPWDFDAPLDGRFTLTQPDSNAAAIATAALLELSQLTPDRIRAQSYEQLALATLDTLSRPPWLAIDDPSCEAILKRGVFDLPHNLGVDEATIWGDFFFLDAALRALKFI